MSTELKPGYKQTEVGVIPEDWDVKPLSTVSTEIGDGIHSTPIYVKSSEFYFVNGNNLVTDRIAITDSTMCVSEAEYNTLRKKLTDRTLLLSINGTIGNLAFYNGEQVVLGKSAAYIGVGTGVSRRFISYCLKNRPTALFFDNELTGTTIRNLSLQSLRNTPIPLPPTLGEQRAIAEVLSDVDGLLGGLDRLIAKKRDLKQAAMQQLLTGQTRLPGFHGEWKLKRLGDVVDTDPENLGRETRPDFDFNYIALEDVDCGFLRSHSEQVFAKAPSRARRKLRTNDVLVSTVRPNLFSHLLFLGAVGSWVCSTGFCVVRCRKGVTHPGYVFFHLFSETVSLQIDALLTGSNYPAINSGDVRALRVPMPDYAEQTAIAEVLTDMDAELTALEQRREKTRALKQAMMQELLTGRTRLV